MSPIRKFVRGRAQSFGPAYQGWRFVLATQPNAWIHAVISVLVIAAGFWLQIGRAEWLAILLATGLVWVAEFLNTALEAVVDLASPRQHRLAKIAKDVSAAAVVIAALTAVLVGVVALWPPLSSKLGL